MLTPTFVDILPFLRHKIDCALENDMENANSLGYTLEEYREFYGLRGCTCGLQQLLFGVESAVVDAEFDMSSEKT